jgi:Transcriptional regulators
VWFSVRENTTEKGERDMFSYKQIQSLNELEMEVYNYVILHLDEVATVKIRDLADQAHVSTTTIMRFCNKLDCNGYSEFKVKIKLMHKEKKKSDFFETPQLMQEFF